MKKFWIFIEWFLLKIKLFENHLQLEFWTFLCANKANKYQKTSIDSTMGKKSDEILGRSDHVAIIMGRRRGSLRDNIFELVEITGVSWRLWDASGLPRSNFQKLTKLHIWPLKCLFLYRKNYSDTIVGRRLSRASDHRGPIFQNIVFFFCWGWSSESNFRKSWVWQWGLGNGTGSNRLKYISSLLIINKSIFNLENMPT